MAEKTYTVVVGCQNCGQQNSIEVPKGTLKTDVVNTQKKICDNCGCAIIQNDAALSASA